MKKRLSVIGKMILTVWFAMFLTAFAGEGNGNVDSVTDKFALWTGKTQLRGANIWQAIVIPDLDGPDFKGSGPVGPPYTQNDFNRLAAWGANYVNIPPGFFHQNSALYPEPKYPGLYGQSAHQNRQCKHVCRDLLSYRARPV